MKKPQLAIAYYYNGEDEKDAEVYVSMDNFSKKEFLKYCKNNEININICLVFDIYPIKNSFSLKNGYFIELKKI
ncbi:MAG TPA: hypothetical protein DDY21_00125 [Candidatus Moranbacteria bacterium]|nr:hypothetical protein [Candidatus Moranbacteria bacterium]